MADAEQRGGPVPVFEPGQQRLDYRPRIVIGLDTSSSIDAQTLQLFTTEAEAIVRRTNAEAHLLAFDETVFAQMRLDQTGWSQLRDMPLRTGGGTDFYDLFEKANKIGPSIIIILTDLDAPLPPAPQFPIVWAVPHTVPSPPYGRVLGILD